MSDREIMNAKSPFPSYLHEMNGYEFMYRRLLWKILDNGIHRDDRTGVGCKSLFNLSLEVDVSDKFPILTGRRMYPKIFNTEFNWLLNGETNIKCFQDAGVTIWDEWADKNGDLGPVYGHQLRNFNSQDKDQLEDTIRGLRINPDGRRHVISLWNPVQLEEMALPPCYLYFQFFVDGDKLNMFVVQRSGDMFLGVPYDVALFTLILNYVAERTFLKPSKLALNIIDAHIYDNQFEAVKDYLNQPVVMSPSYTYSSLDSTVTLQDYKPGKRITAPVAI